MSASHIGLGHITIEPGEAKYYGGQDPFASVPLGGGLNLFLTSPDDGRALIAAIESAIALLEAAEAGESR
jgi:hypothetical protein